MNRAALTLLALLLTSAAGFAQGFYFRGGLGYALPMAGQTIDGTGTPLSGTRSNSSFLRTYNMKNVSFSSGVQGTLGIGYMFSGNVGLQLDVNTGLFTKKYSFTDQNVLIDLGAGPILSNYTISQQADLPLMLAPSLVVQTSGKGKVGLYTRVGPVIPLITNVIQENYVQNVPGTGAISSTNFIFTLKSSFSMGFSAAGGLQYKLGSKATLWMELSMLSMSLYLKQSDLTGFEYNGQSYSLSNVLSPHTYHYSKNAKVDTNGINQPTYSLPFSNVGVNVGVRISMGKRSKHGGAGRTGEADRKEMSTRPKSGRFR